MHENDVEPKSGDRDDARNEPEDAPLPPVEVTGSTVFTEQDFVSVWLELPHVKRLMASLIYLILGLTLVGWSGVFDEKHKYAVAATIALLGVGALVFGSKGVRSAFARQSLAAVGAEGHAAYSFDSSGFSVHRGPREVQFDWSDALMFVETRQAFVIYTEPRELLVVPKRSFEPYKIPDLRQLLSELVPAGRSSQVGNWRQSLLKSLLFLAALWALAKILSF